MDSFLDDVEFGNAWCAIVRPLGADHRCVLSKASFIQFMLDNHTYMDVRSYGMYSRSDKNKFQRGEILYNNTNHEKKLKIWPHAAMLNKTTM